MNIRVIIVVILFCLGVILCMCKKSDEENNSAPAAAFTITPSIGDTQTDFIFDASGSTDNEDPTPTLRVRWDWENDGAWDTDWSSNKVVNHTFTQVNDYSVTMEVIDTQGLTDATSNTVTVSNGWNEPPHANFYANNTWVSAGQTVFFYDQSANSASNWEWDFGDGGTSLQKNPSHIYSEDGNYTVILSVSNSFGTDTETKPNYITVGSGGSFGEPCPGLETITYGGQVYNTVLIGDQCWLKENLNIGLMIDGSMDQEDNDTIEKYCYDNDPVNCEIYGGLYEWGEVMQYVLDSGAQGICPEGWHIPTDDEWKILDGTADSQYPVGDPEWDKDEGRGYDAGKNLKSTFGWFDDGNGTNLYGFRSLAGGNRNNNGFSVLTRAACFWTSTYGDPQAWSHIFDSSVDYSIRSRQNWSLGFSIRCIKD
ncbi:MAG: PKD domain-containing protein [Bacteroidetes bacterium]|nr:PKD domain-containing protein [Bacteroidota bacterium]